MASCHTTLTSLSSPIMWRNVENRYDRCVLRLYSQAVQKPWLSPDSPQPIGAEMTHQQLVLCDVEDIWGERSGRSTWHYNEYQPFQPDPLLSHKTRAIRNCSYLHYYVQCPCYMWLYNASKYNVNIVLRKYGVFNL